MDRSTKKNKNKNKAHTHTHIHTYENSQPVDVAVHDI